MKLRCQRSNLQSTLDGRGYAGWRGACARGLALNSSQRPAGLCCGRLVQSASRMHPRQSRVPREISGLAAGVRCEEPLVRQALPDRQRR